MNESDQRMCDGRHHDLDVEVRRLRERLDGNGQTGLVPRVTVIETCMKDVLPTLKATQALTQRLTILVAVMSVLLSGDLFMRAIPFIKLIVP